MIYSKELLSWGEEECSPGHEFGGKREYYLLHIILDGKGEFFSNGRSWSVRKGEAFLIFPEQMHLYRADLEEPWSYFWVSFNGDFSGLFNPLQIDQKHPVIHNDNSEYLYQLFNEINRSATFLHPADNLKNLGWLNLILGELCRGRVSIDYKQKKEDSGSSHHVDSMNTFITKNFDTPIKVQDVIEFVCLERSYASRLFKEEFGISIGRFIKDKRIQRAKEYLKVGYSGKETAYSCGFSDYYNFLKAFKKYTGKTPGEFKKM